MKKNWMIGCGIVMVLMIGLGVAVAGLVASLFVLTTPVADASGQFLDQLGRGKSADAYASAAADFRSQCDADAFAAAVRELGLDEFASVAWHNRQIDNLTALAEGTVTTKSGGTRPVSVRLVRENDRWAVAGVGYNGIDLGAVAARRSVPAGADLETLVGDTLRAFGRAVRARDFTAFYDSLANEWKKQTTAQRLQASFQEFLDKDVVVDPVREDRPVFSPAPAVNEQGVLVVAGRYTTRPDSVGFNLEYARESGGWKLRGIGVSVPPAGGAGR